MRKASLESETTIQLHESDQKQMYEDILSACAVIGNFRSSLSIDGVRESPSAVLVCQDACDLREQVRYTPRRLGRRSFAGV